MYESRIESNNKLRRIRQIISSELWRADLGLEDHDELPIDIDMPTWVQRRATKIVASMLDILEIP